MESASIRLSPPNVDLSSQKFDDLVSGEKRASTIEETKLPSGENPSDPKNHHSCPVSGCKFVALHAKDLTRHARTHTGKPSITEICNGVSYHVL